MIPWGTRENLSDDEFYNRTRELNNMKSLLETTANGNAPEILLTGQRGVGKTVFLKKIKKELDQNYLVVYMNFSKAECYQKNNMSIKGLLEYFLREFLIEAKEKNLNTLDKKIEKYFKTNNFSIKEFIQIDKFQIPIFSSETNVEKLFDFVLSLPQKIYDKNSYKLSGIIIFIDEFQIIKELNEYKESFLWKLRSYIQNQNNVSYLFSGSMSLQDELITEIASQRGAFGGRMLTIHLTPFDKKTTKNYLNKEAPNLLFNDKGFERFYKCTSGIPSYINIFATLLPKDKELDEKEIIKQFEEKITVINTHLLVIWNKLTLREQNIIISLLNEPLARKDIAKALKVTTGSLSKPLINLQHQELIIYENNYYHINDKILKRWLELEFKENKNYPYRI